MLASVTQGGHKQLTWWQVHNWQVQVPVICI